MSTRILNLIIACLVTLVVGCGGSTVEVNSFSNSNGTTGPNLSGQTGTVTVQTQVATGQISAQQSIAIQSDVIPAFVDELRFTGQDQFGFLVYGPVVRAKAGTIELDNVPIEVVSLRIELLTNGFVVGGLVTPINVPTNEVVFLTNPVYVFAGVGSDSTNVVYGLFRGEQTGTEPPSEPEGEFGIDDAPVFDFDQPQVTNGVSRTSPGFYTVSQEGDYLLTYSLEIVPFLDSLLTQISRNSAFVENTRVDVADLDEIIFVGPPMDLEPLPMQSSTALQSFQHIVTLQAGDTVALRVRDYNEAGQIRGQFISVFPLIQGSFSIVRLGSGGVTAPPPAEQN